MTEIASLELLARVVLEQPNDDTARQIFSSYNAFLLTLSHPDQRKALDRITFDESSTDPTYTSLRGASRDFRSGTNSLFFDDHPMLKQLIRQYGVF